MKPYCQFIRQIDPSDYAKGCVLTVGNFDGVHRGHQAILAQTLREARSRSLPAVVMLFEPQPLEYFRGQEAAGRLTRLREKIALLRQEGIDKIVCLRFNAALAALTADQFIEQILVNGLNVRCLIAGGDFRFGYQRQGDFRLLQAAGKSCAFDVLPRDAVLLNDRRISSTWVREVLQQGDLAQAQLLLGRPFCLSGRVTHGDKRGRVIGFPTANIPLHRAVSPLQGVFAVRVSGLDRPYVGVANLGNRPTAGGTVPLLEVHIFDFMGDIYGHHLTIELVQKLRDEQRFASFELLKEQIFKDAAQARVVFGVSA